MLVLTGLFATACGFKMQGRDPLPPLLATPYVQATDAQSDFVQGLRKALLTSGAKLTPGSDNASAVVRVLEDDVSRKILSVSARNTPREYEITYKVRFSVSSNGKEVLEPQEIELTRDYSFDETLMLAKENEESILREALARDLVGMVMRRLSSL